MKTGEVGGEMPGTARGSLDAVPTLVRDPQPAEFEALLERRSSLGQDRFDEVWQGVYHMNPAPTLEHQRVSQQLAELLGPLAREAGLDPAIGGVNIGLPEDFRSPDGSVHRPGASGTWLATAALVIEIVSPGDEAWDKLSFYAAHQVDELLIVDLARRQVQWLALDVSGEYKPIERSTLIGLGAAELAERLNWPE
jgi:Uma2 family endonuclease